MALDIEKKKHTPEAPEEKSKGLNTFLWLLTVVIIAATGSIFHADPCCCCCCIATDCFRDSGND